jgi:threonine aldolase
LVRPIHEEDGILTWDEIRKHLRPFSQHNAPTSLIEIENTFNMAGGTVYPMAILNDICDRAHDLGLKVHLDGARIFNSATYLNLPVAEIVAKADTVMFCLSKGLGAPAGSLVVGGDEAVGKARLYRKRLGGGMRQAGVLAAAGLISLEEMPKRLGDDHANARHLASRIAGIPGVKLDPSKVQTNIVVFDITETGLTSPELSKMLRERGVRMNGATSTLMRAVTHYDVTRADCDEAVEVLSGVLAETRVVQHAAG